MKRFLPYFKLLKNVWPQFVGALLTGFIFGVASGFGLPYVSQKVFPVLFGGKEVDMWTLVLYLCILPAAFAIRGISGFFNTYLISYCGTDILNHLRRQVFTKLQQMPILAYQSHPTGDLLTRTTGDTAQLQNTLMTVSNDMIKYPVTLVSALAAVVYLAVTQNQLGFIVILLGVIPVCVIPVRVLGQLLQKRARQGQGQVAGVTDILSENIRGVREIKLYGQEEQQSKRFDVSIKGLQRYTLKIVKYQASLNPIIEFISVIGVTIAIYYAYKAHLKLEVVVPLIMALYMAYEPVKKIGAVHNSLKLGEASLDRIEELLNEPTEVPEPTNPVEIARAKGNVTFENISFGYPRAERLALNNFSLTIPAGTVVGIVGPSGAGKTTLIGLVPRLFDPKEGTVKVDGIDIRQLRTKDLRAQIAAVPQDAFLFNDSVLANIALGETITDEVRQRAIAAAQQAQAHQFIVAMPHGYDTTVGEAGGQLSGGQRQRLAIARAFYKNAPILVMDEPTSALDAENENEIFSSLKDLASGRTALIVSHRLKSLVFCHKIAYLEDGRLIDYGTHDELIARCTGYKNLYLMGGERTAEAII